MNIALLWGVAGLSTLIAFIAGLYLARRWWQSPTALPTPYDNVAGLIERLEELGHDLQQSEDALRQQRRWAENLIESIVEGVITLDRRGRITSFSHGAERITGWSRVEAVGAPAAIIFRTPPEGPSFWEQIPPAGGEHKVTIFNHQGTQMILSVTGARLLPPAGGSAQVALVLRDVTEEEAAIRATNELLANVSHEFRTPLSALAASVELLAGEEKLAPEERQRLLHSLRRGTLRLQRMVDNLLDSMSIQAGRFQVTPEPMPLAPVINEAVRFMAPLFQQKNQPVQVDLPADLPLVQADERRLAQVLHNLLSNASKYGPPGQPVQVLARQRGREIWVGVSDRGPGIAPADRQRLFHRFGRLPGSNQAASGMGLGLSIVKEIIERHGSQVGVDSQEGEGATFWFTLPIATPGGVTI